MSMSSSSKPSGGWQPPSMEEMQAMLPQYQFVSLLGRGGMGAVYKAVQITLDRPVAIKVLPVDLIDDSDSQFAERFKNEARTMAKMNHPAIVNVYDFGETNIGLLYIVMEFIDGTDVSKMIVSQGKLPEDYALSITAHVCDALNYAHRHGIVHRDIKPANILINMEGAVKVADFGLAKANDPSQSGLTKTNMAMGTPDFVAPEAFIPGVPLDGRADLYAIGVMLYQMLTGEIPRGIWTLPGKKIGADPRFDAIITKAMQTDREERYQSAADLRRDLDTILMMPRAVLIAQQQAAAEAAARATQAQKQAASGPQRRMPEQPVHPAPPPVKKSSLGPILGIAASIALVAGLYVMLTGGSSKKTASNDSAASPSLPAAVPNAVENTPAPSATSPAPAVAATTPAPAPEMAAIPLSVAPADLKPETVHTFGGHRYQLVEESIGWEAAKAKAESMGGHLATITSKEERDWVKNLLLSKKGPHTHVLIGGHRAQENGPWAWVTGEPFDMQLWPANPPTTTDPHLAFYLPDSAWDDIPLGITSPYLVEWDAEGTQPMHAAVTSTTPVMTQPDAPPPPPAPTKSTGVDGWTDLISKIDVAKHTITGQWRVVGGTLQCPDDAASHRTLELPVATIRANYDLRVRLTRTTSGAAMFFAFCQGTSAGGLLMDAWTVNKANSSEVTATVMKTSAAVSVTRDQHYFQTGQKREILFQVRATGLKVLLDGAELLYSNGPWSEFHQSDDYFLPKGVRSTPIFAVGVCGGEVVYHSIEMREVDVAGEQKATLLASSPRLAQLEAGFQTRYQADAEKPFLAALARLNQSYVANGIARARAAAQAKGSLFEVTTLDAEKALIETGGADGVKAISTFKQLRFLRVTAGTASDRDFALLGSLKSLTNLTLSTTAFGNKAAEAVAGIPGLTRLEVANTKLTNSGLEKLHALKNLTELILNGTEVSPQAAAGFQKAMPQCRVSR